MRPIAFRQAEYLLHNPGNNGGRCPNDLPIRYEDGQCVSCWRPSLRERISILLHGRVWLGVRMPRANQPQVWLVARREMFAHGGTSHDVKVVNNGGTKKRKHSKQLPRNRRQNR